MNALDAAREMNWNVLPALRRKLRDLEFDDLAVVDDDPDLQATLRNFWGAVEALEMVCANVIALKDERGWK